MKNVIVPLAEGFEEIEALSIVDILRRAGIQVVTAALTTKEVRGAHGVVVVADALIGDLTPEHFDMIALPGGLPGATNLAKDVNVQRWLKGFDAQEKAIAAICAAPYALDQAGVLKARYTCYPGFQEKITQTGYQRDENVVSEANVTTSKGPATAMLFALALVEKLCSKETAKALAKDLLLH